MLWFFCCFLNLNFYRKVPTVSYFSTVFILKTRGAKKKHGEMGCPSMGTTTKPEITLLISTKQL